MAEFDESLLSKNDKGGKTKITDSMVWAGLEVYFSFDREWDDPAEIVRSIFETMINREFAEKCPQSDPAPLPRQSPFRSPIGASADQKR